MKRFKSGIILLIGMLFLIVINSNVVLGASDEFEQIFPSNNSSNTQSIDDEEEEEEEEEDDDDENNTNNSIGSFIELTSNNTNTNNSNSNANNTSVLSNRSASNNSTLAKTGINDFSGFSAVIITICVISAIYSLKKFSEYKNM